MDNPETTPTTQTPEVSQQDVHIVDSPEVPTSEPTTTPEPTPAPTEPVVEPVTPAEPTQPTESVLDAEVVPQETPLEKTVYGFTKEELDWLEGRYQSLVHFANVTKDLGTSFEGYIVQNVCKRLGVDPFKDKVDYNIPEKTLTVSKQEPPNEPTQNQS